MKNKIFCLIIFIDFFICNLEAAQVDLKKITVSTSTRTKEYIKNLPSNISVITQNEIKASGSTTIAEVLKTEASLNMMDYLPNGKTVSADMRGFGETGLSNVLVLLDGRRINNIDLSGTDWTQIPLSSVERIEVVRGSSSVLYGDNAAGGVINIITKVPIEKVEFKLESLIGSYSTFGEKAEVSFAEKNFYILGLFDQYRTDGYRINSELLRNDYTTKIGYNLNDNLKTQITFGEHTDKYGLPGYLYDIDIKLRGRHASITPDDYASSRDYYLKFDIERDLNNSHKFELSLSRRKRDTHANWASGPWITERDTITYSASPKYTLSKDLFGHKNSLICGIDFYDAEQDINDGGYSGGPDKATVSKASTGLYLLNQFYIFDNLSVSSGYRHEEAKYNFEQEEAVKRSEAKVFEEDVASFALNYIYNKDSNVYLSYSDSFRHPLVDEYFNTSAFSPSGINLALTPQTARNYEAGIRHYLNKNFLIGLSGYIMKLHNEIYYEPTTFANSNYDNTVHRGIEFQGNLKLNDKIRLFSNYAFTNAEFEGDPYDKKKIPAVPEHKWSMGSEVNITKNLKLSLIGYYAGERYFISDQANSLPRMASYLTLNTKILYTKDNLSAYFTINNLLDEEYYEYGVANSTRTTKVYYPSPERNFIVGGSLKF